MTSPTLIDFNDLDAGDIVGGQYSSKGVTIGSYNRDGSVDHQNPPMIFDTAHPTGGDHDLATSNLGKVLILSEDRDSRDPDDNAAGGNFLFSFDDEVTVNSLTLLDVEEGAWIKLYDENGRFLKQIDVKTANNGQKNVHINTPGAKYMVVTLGGSGAVDNLSFTAPPMRDGVVNGTDDADLIDLAYVDAQGDRIDANDALGVEGTTGDADVVEAGAGNDTVYAGAANDIVRGGAGHDRLFGQDGDDTLEGGDGADRLEGGDGNDLLDGGSDRDTIFGGAGNDTIRGGGGDDEIWAGTGNDSVRGGTGNDWIHGESGNDTLHGDDGHDMLFGEAGNDELSGGAGDDLLKGGDGHDSLSGDTGHDSLDGGADNDFIQGGTGRDTVQGGTGNDTIFSGVTGRPDLGYPGLFDADGDPEDDRDLVDGGAGDDSIVTGDDADTIFGGTGNDTIDAGFDRDLVDGGEGDDLIVGGEGSDTIEGGAGNDTIYGGLDPRFDDRLNIPDATDRVQDNGRDVIDGGDGDDLIFGQDDDDSILGGAGDDTIDGGIDEDTIEGGAGNDVIIGGLGADSLSGGDDRDTFAGSQSDPEILSVQDGDVIDGGEGGDDFDTLDLTGVRAVVELDADNPENGTIFFTDADGVRTGETARFVNIENIIGGTVRDGIVSGTGGDDLIDVDYTGDPDGDRVDANDAILPGEVGDDDIIRAGAGDDTIFAGAGDDEVDAGAGNDLVFGEDGEDVLSGGSGADTITGGDGADRIDGGDDRDLILGATTGDVIHGGSGGDDFDTLDLTGSDVSFITYDPENRENGIITFRDETTASFSDIEAVVPCFTPGTLIATPRGEVPVETLAVGDRVITRDNGIQVVRWVGAREIAEAELLEDGALRPVMIRRGALGHGLPERDMAVSPQHRVLIASDETMLYFDEREVLVAARHLVGRPGVERVEAGAVTYVHLMFDNHEVILSDGAWTESFQPGDHSLKGLGRAQRDEIFSIFPELRRPEGREGYVAARRMLKRKEAELLVRC